MGMATGKGVSALMRGNVGFLRPPSCGPVTPGKRPRSRKREITRSPQKTISDSAPPTTSAEAGWIVPGYGILPW